MTEEKVALGRLLFYERRLSITGRHACSTCHAQRLAFTDGLARAVGATGEAHPRSAMSLANVAYNPVYTWTDAGFASLEAQVAQPLFNEHPIEMGLAGRESAVLAELGSDAQYREAFARAFPQESSPVTMANVARALASFERTLISGRSAFDRYVYGDERGALDAAAQAWHGTLLFGADRLRPMPLRHQFLRPHRARTHSAGGSRVREYRRWPLPRADAAQCRADRALHARRCGAHACRGHRSLRDSWPGASGSSTPADAPQDERLRPFSLSSRERDDLHAFLESLTDPEFLADTRFAAP